jgi:thioredoxin reductase (NADPH)
VLYEHAVCDAPFFVVERGRVEFVDRKPGKDVHIAEADSRTFVAEAWAPGGQAGTSTRIENYLGFPSGISGTDLTRKATLQARRFDAVLSSFHRAVELTDGPEGPLRVDLDDGQHVLARSVLMATGARWRELDAEGMDRFRGAGVYHAAMSSDAERARDKDVIVVGVATRPARPPPTSPAARTASASSSAAKP